MVRIPVSRSLRRATAAALAIALPALPLGAQAASAIDVPTIKYERFVLPNGLVAILNENHASPVVTVSIWYHVGSRNEVPGKTGLAHLFEHMMFEGSQNVAPGQHRTMIQSMGGAFNGNTYEDRTTYYDVVPSNELETALWMESDRMATLLTRVDQARLDAQREIVKNERRVRVDNVTFGAANEITLAQLYPPGHPYNWILFGSMADLSAASLDDVKSFFRTYYTPNNATVVISGDFKPAEARQMVHRYFGPIARGPAIARSTPPQITLSAEKRLVLEDARARLPQLRFAWPTIGNGHADLVALQILGTALTLDRAARLTKLLVYDRQLATSVNAANFDFESPNNGIFQIAVTPRPNASLTEIERVVDSVIASVKASPLSVKELQRVKSADAVTTVTGLQTGFQRTELLGQGEAFDKNPLSRFAVMTEFVKVTPADVQRVAGRYLTEGRMVLSMVPAGKLDQISKPDQPYTNVTPGRSTGAGGR